jgi:hypothetical protein
MGTRKGALQSSIECRSPSPLKEQSVGDVAVVIMLAGDDEDAEGGFGAGENDDHPGIGTLSKREHPAPALFQDAGAGSDAYSELRDNYG